MIRAAISENQRGDHAQHDPGRQKNSSVASRSRRIIRLTTAKHPQHRLVKQRNQRRIAAHSLRLNDRPQRTANRFADRAQVRWVKHESGTDRQHDQQRQRQRQIPSDLRMTANALLGAFDPRLPAARRVSPQPCRAAGKREDQRQDQAARPLRNASEPNRTTAITA